MKKFWVVFAGIIFAANGCGRSESVKPQEALTREALTVSEADMILAEAADPHPPSPTGVADASQSAGEAMPDASSGNPAADVHADKKAIQEVLKALGLYDGAIDGKIGPKSEAAIKEFQRSHNLAVDGKVGPKTWAALKVASAQKTAASGVHEKSK